MAPIVSVVVCTHNPRQDYLVETLAALRGQTLPPTEWDLLIVDNACDPPIDGRFDVAWHPRARCVREPQLGVVHARLRGIAESRGDVLVYVDDDNVLDADYLAHVVEIAETFPHLGAWGGQGRPRYEQAPSPSTKRYCDMLGIRDAPVDRWGNVLGVDAITPWGAGMCVRRVVASRFFETVQKDPRRLALGRRGRSLVSGEDVDIAYTAVDVGLGMGVFNRLRFTHIIPRSRVDEDYLVRLVESIAYSNVWLRSLRGERPPASRDSLPRRAWRFLDDTVTQAMMSRFDRRMARAWARGMARATAELSR